MTSTNQVLSSTSSSAAATTTASAAKGSETSAGLQNRFLTLLVAQMKNQDPLNPLDNAQVTTQLAQINTVNGIQSLNDTMSLLSSNFNNLQLVQGANMIGHEVLVPSSTLNLSGGTAAGGFSLDQAADKVTIEIRDASGKLVQSVDLGAKAAGAQGFGWDGKDNQNAQLADGKYNLTVKATQGGQSIPATALGLGQVLSLTPGANGMQISVYGLGQFALSDVKQMI